MRKLLIFILFDNGSLGKLLCIFMNIGKCIFEIYYWLFVQTFWVFLNWAARWIPLLFWPFWNSCVFQIDRWNNTIRKFSSSKLVNLYTLSSLSQFRKSTNIMKLFRTNLRRLLLIFRFDYQLPETIITVQLFIIFGQRL